MMLIVLERKLTRVYKMRKTENYNLIIFRFSTKTNDLTSSEYTSGAGSNHKDAISITVDKAYFNVIDLRAQLCLLKINLHFSVL